MAKKENISRLGTKPEKPSGLRESHLQQRSRAFAAMVEAINGLNKDERTNCLAAVAEFYGLTLVVEN